MKMIALLAATYGGMLTGVASVTTGWADLMVASLLAGAAGPALRLLTEKLWWVPDFQEPPGFLPCPEPVRAS